MRERSRLVLEKAKKNQLKHFDVDMTKFGDTASYVVSIIKVCIILLCSRAAIHLCEELVELTSDSEISKTSVTPQFLPTADGSTLTSVAAHVSSN